MNEIEEVPARCVVLVACTPAMHQAAEGAVISARAQVEADPTLFDSLDLVGPVLFSKIGRRLFGLGRTDGQAIDDGLRSALAQSDLEPGARIGLGFVLVSQDEVIDLQARVSTIITDPSLASLHPLGRGISFADATDPSADVASVEMLAGTPRLDSSIVSSAELILAKYLADETMLIKGSTLSRLVPELRASPLDEPRPPEPAEPTIVAPPTPAPGPIPEASHSPGVGALTPPAAPLPPLRLTYFVIDTSRDAKPRAKSARLTSLVLELDKELVPPNLSMRSDSILVASNYPDLATAPKPTGTILGSDMWPASGDNLDFSVTMTRLRDLIVRNRESKTRRKELLTTPLVIFILPTAALFGAATIASYRDIKTLAEVGWLVTDREGPPPSIEIDQERLVFDHPDAVNEILYKLGYPEEEVSPTSPGTEPVGIIQKGEE